MKLPLLVVALGFWIWVGDVRSAEEGRLTSLERLETKHLRAAREAREQFDRDRKEIPNLGVYQDYRAVIHVHAEDADHTKGTRQQVLSAAREAGVRVVMFTDHDGPKPETWRGLKEGVLFIAGAEESSGSLRFPLMAEEGTENELRFLCHVEDRYDANLEGYAGMEICNRHTDAKLDETSLAYLIREAADPESWRKITENLNDYPNELFAAGTDYRSEIFAKWDRELQGRHVTGIGGNDAHRNTIVQGLLFDPYEVSFRNLSTHILARELTEPAIRQSLRDGHVYVSHDWLCDPAGFAFVAGNNLGVYTMGDSIPWVGKTRLYVKTPLSAKLKLIHNGKVIQEVVADGLTNVVAETGAYRVEAWLAIDGEERPWIYANPIYVENPAADALRLPSMELSAGVERMADLPYLEDGNESKHKLDIYRVKREEPSPVLFFVHGGAWKSGDRSLYVPLGNRFAREGVLTVIPSYRLAPQHPHPAQIEDVAAAFAWTLRHVADYGGDTNRLYLAGHSAGGHLVALLALDPRFLQAYQMAPSSIRGVVALSGVFDLTEGDGQSSVFGRDADARRDASPLFHVTRGAPPFLVGYCQWDYATLAMQGRQLHEALVRAGDVSEERFIAERSHITEMLGIDQNKDPTAAMVLGYIRRDGRTETTPDP